VAPFKPAETGCERGPESKELIPADALLLKDACRTEAPLDLICPYRFVRPLAPWVAAQQEGKEIEATRLTECFEQLAAGHDAVLVETAGGILVPLAERLHYGDLARLLDVPVLVVAGSKLGAINHTLLTLDYLRQAELTVVGCVLNHPYDAASPAVETNEETIRKLAGTAVWAVPRSRNGLPQGLEEVFDHIATRCLAVQ
jgi:dethiobiotin synthetase